LVVAVVILELIGAVDFFRAATKSSAVFKERPGLKKGESCQNGRVEIGRSRALTSSSSAPKVDEEDQGQVGIKTDSKAAIKFTGLMGQNFVSIEGGSAAAPPALAGATLDTVEQPTLAPS